MEKETVDIVFKSLSDQLTEAHKELRAAQEKYDEANKVYCAFYEEMKKEGFVNYGMCDWRK